MIGFSAPTPKRAVRRRRRFTPLALATGAVGVIVLAFSMNTSLAAFTASITNSINTAAAGTLIMQEQYTNGGTTTTCLSTDGTGTNYTTNTATCSTINKYGGSTTMVPGQTVTTTVTIKNTGTAPAASFTLAPGTCTQTGGITGSATDLCAKLGVVITQSVNGATATTITPASSTLTTLASGGSLTLAAPVAPNTVITYVFAVTLSSTTANTYQGLAASQPLVWTFTS